MSLGLIGSCCDCGGVTCSDRAVVAMKPWEGFTRFPIYLEGTTTGAAAQAAANALQVPRQPTGQSDFSGCGDYRERTKYLHGVFYQEGPLTTIPWEMTHGWLQVEVWIDQRVGVIQHYKLTSSGAGAYEWQIADSGTVTTSGSMESLEVPLRLTDLADVQSGVYGTTIDVGGLHGVYTGAGQVYNYQTDSYVDVHDKVENTISGGYTLDAAIADAQAIADAILDGSTHEVWFGGVPGGDNRNLVFGNACYWFASYTGRFFYAGAADEEENYYPIGVKLEDTTYGQTEAEDYLGWYGDVTGGGRVWAGVQRATVAYAGDLYWTPWTPMSPSTVASPDDGSDGAWGTGGVVTDYVADGATVINQADLPASYGKAWLRHGC